ncbi:tRNA (adenosine(37)-N6)-threonylcarbamoyltransferase complex dimerization subunit type 1 TsaB [Actinokineospora sp. NBRC 105648]|uniref:tRNA (adenosine(37)-N6)-threonylcarbamoyltransferase complex dimerization subunit type 1 TsaB n=1 Tax=Actinokineospora sp. NBRC 105648 TaxID=3032206 RepID=UPI0024A0EA0D|nr:tRNA (adenosine(37)-N6)-threonylcarbamoyltransferase complex dimerization subunit type 1 TsaB [Actinokineospora sp. NBRC 105648]GLZ42079.1 tRNA (adenosine(37)-N6)-threonylcarbamoyltransferase complex dimerization subunit type 1 TsaB [Actinokineospora sp. NBRC 105648]
MLVLAVDTATPAVTAGVVELVDGSARLLAARVTVDARAHGELLSPHLRDALAAAGRTLAQVDAVVCGVGPGPFTGLRAGMVTAAALGHSLDRPVYPVCSLDAIAADAAADPPGGPLLVVTDARRREVYWAAYAADGSRVAGPSVTPPAEVPVAELGVTRVAGARVFDFGLPAVGPEHPSPLGLVAAADLTAEPGPLTPLYLRRPDAVEPGARKRVSPG